MIYDVIILGAGPAGLTAGIYCSRKKLTTLVLTYNVGGQVLETEDIENYPGFKLITGKQLIERFQQHVEDFGVEIKAGVMAIGFQRSPTGFMVTTDKGEKFTGKTVIVAAGRAPRELPLEGVKKYLGRGLSYCATCDAPFYQDKTVVVVGGSNAGAETVLAIAAYAAKLYWLELQPRFPADGALMERIKHHNGKITMMAGAKIAAIQGEEKITGITIEQNGQQQSLAIDGMFVEIGSVPATDFLKDIVDLNEKKEIKIDQHNQTSVAGIFAAGDITDVLDKQIIVAAGEGAKAALSAYLFLQI